MSTRFILRMTVPSMVISLLLLGLGSLSGWYVHRLQKSTAALVALDMSTIHAVEQLVFAINDVRTELGDFLLSADRSHLDAIRSKCAEAERWLCETESLVDDDDEISLVRRIRDGYQHFAEASERLVQDPSPQSARTGAERLNSGTVMARMLAPTRELLALEAKLVRQSGDYNQGMAARIAMVLWLLGACGAVAGLVAGFGIARSVSRSIVELYIPIKAASGRLEEVIGPVDVVPSVGIENLDVILRSMADRVGTVVDRLRQSEMEVLRAEQMAALGQLAAGLAHELRNPLTAMKMLIQAAVATGPSASLAGRDLRVLESETMRLERSIQTFLDFARPPTLEKRPCDVRRAIQQTVELVAARAARQGVAIRCDMADRPWIIDADQEQLRQVFLNLVFNALDMLPKGGAITIAIAQSNAPDRPADRSGGIETDESTSWITITVADNGPGIPANLKDRIFEPYVSTKDTGLGLGLAICRRIVETHGGRVAAANDPQAGAVFSVQLPARMAAEEPGRPT